MIPKIIHYCWFGRGKMPELALKCIESWHKYMPNWEYRLWNEDNFDVNRIPYTKEAYSVGKYAFVSDYVRLWALERFGGLYLDVDFEVFKSFDALLDNESFAGYEGSKYSPVMMGVIASQAKNKSIQEMLDAYLKRHFVDESGILDMMPNTSFFYKWMKTKGYVLDGKEKVLNTLHIYPVDYFCPMLTTGEYVRSENTYCEHKGLNSWSGKSIGWKATLLKLIDRENMIKLIKLKRKILG